MAGGKIVGITIDIEGKSDGLVKALKTVDSSINATSSALKDVDKALQLDPTNVELLAQKEELLNKQIDQTNQRLEIMQQVAQDANAALDNGDITQEQYASLTAEISRTNSELDSLTQQANDNSQAMEDIENGVDGAADEMTELDEASESTGHSLEGLKVTAEAVGGAMAAAFGAAVAAAKEVGGALVDCTISAGNYVDEINTLSQKTGVSTETLQEWNYVSGLIDVDVNTLTGSLTKLEKSMGAAADQQFKYDTGLADLNRSLKEGKISHDEYEKKVEELGEKTSTAYDKLGVAIYDSNHNLRDNEEVMFEVLEALSQMPEGVERDLLSIELLGKSAKELGPLLQEGAIDKFKDLSQEAHDVGYVLEGDTFDAFQEFDDQMERFSKSGEAAKNALGTVLLPTLNSLSTAGTGALNKFTKAMNDSNGDISKLGPAVSGIMKDLLGEVNKVAPQFFELIGTIIQTLVQIIIDNLPMFLDSAMQIITTLTETLLAPDNLAKIIEAATNIVLTIVQYLLENIGMILDAAIQIVLTVVKGITDALPKLIPAVVDAVLTIAETLLAPENLSMILDAGLQLIIALAGALVDALPQIIERLPEIILGITDFLLGPEGLDKLISTGFDLFVGLVTKMPEVITDVLEAVGGMIGDIVGKIVEKGVEVWDACKDMFPSLDDVLTWGSDMIHGIIDGITGALGDLWDCCKSVGQGIADFLGFSVPKKGPLHHADEWGPDFVDLYSEGIEENLPELQKTIDMTANVIAGTSNDTIAAMQSASNSLAGAAFGANQLDYTNQLNGIMGAIAGMNGETQVIVPVYIGDYKLQTLVASANRNNNYISGGR